MNPHDESVERSPKQGESILGKTDFILVRPQYPGNAGSVARALKNCGFKNLIFVQPGFSTTDLEVKKYAVGAFDLIERAAVYPRLQDALSPYQLLIGTSRRRGNYRQNWVTLKEVTSLIHSREPLEKIGFLFGNEVSGLANDEFKHCQYMLEIPAHQDFASFNLAQAVLLVAHELFSSSQQVFPEAVIPQKIVHPTQQQLEGMYDHLQTMLTAIGFVKGEHYEHIPRMLRNVFNRAQLTPVEVRIIRGICRQVLWFLEKQNQQHEPPIL